MIEGFVCRDVLEGIVRMCSIVRELGEKDLNIENGIINKAKNPARTRAIIHVLGTLRLSSLNRLAKNYTRLVGGVSEGRKRTIAKETTTNAQNMPV